MVTHDPFADELEGNLPFLKKYARRFFKRDSSAQEDLVQDTLERALKARDSYMPAKSMRSWLSVIMCHVAIDQTRREITKKNGLADYIYLNSEYVPPTQATVVECKQVVENISLLRPVYRQAITICILGEREYEECARILNIPLNTFRTRLRRARAALGQLTNPAA